MKSIYNKRARLFSSIAAMAIPLIVLSFIFIHMGIPTIWDIPGTKAITSFIPSALIIATIGYLLEELFNSTSKIIFQFPLFSENETNMPTTKLLSWSSKERLSDDMIKQIAIRVRYDFGITLMSATEEKKKSNAKEAKRRIVDAVGKIREETRENENLMRYNIQYGFCRNYLGGSVYALLFLVVAIIINCNIAFMNNILLWMLLGIQIILVVLFFFSLKHIGNSYARALYNAYISKK